MSREYSSPLYCSRIKNARLTDTRFNEEGVEYSSAYDMGLHGNSRQSRVQLCIEMKSLHRAYGIEHARCSTNFPRYSQSTSPACTYPTFRKFKVRRFSSQSS